MHWRAHWQRQYSSMLNRMTGTNCSSLTTAFTSVGPLDGQRLESSPPPVYSARTPPSHARAILPLRPQPERRLFELHFIRPGPIGSPGSFRCPPSPSRHPLQFVRPPRLTLMNVQTLEWPRSLTGVQNAAPNNFSSNGSIFVPRQNNAGIIAPNSSVIP